MTFAHFEFSTALATRSFLPAASKFCRELERKTFWSQRNPFLPSVPPMPSPPKTQKRRASPTASARSPGQRVLVYGATGYTGNLVAQRAKETGLPVTLAGRNEEKVRAVAEPLGLQHVVFELGDQKALDKAVAGHSAVLHIAGPYTETAPPMLDSCLRNGVHYLDVTGESNVMQMAHARSKEAEAKKTMLVCGVGYDTVPGDCLAAHLKKRLASATHLALGLFMQRRPSPNARASHGTALSAMLHILPRGGLVRDKGQLKKEPSGVRTFNFDLRDGKKPLKGWSFGAAEVFVTGLSTGIPNITAYLPGNQAPSALRALEFLGPQGVNFGPVRWFLENLVRRQQSGVTEEQLKKGPPPEMTTIGVAWDERTGKRVVSTVTTSEGYRFTAAAAVECARRVLDGQVKPGYQTPVTAFGADLLLSLRTLGVKVNLTDVE
eukprot:jgi/Mesvir1/21746/Mv04153-RA.1